MHVDLPKLAMSQETSNQLSSPTEPNPRILLNPYPLSFNESNNDNDHGRTKNAANWSQRNHQSQLKEPKKPLVENLSLKVEPSWSSSFISGRSMRAFHPPDLGSIFGALAAANGFNIARALLTSQLGVFSQIMTVG